MDQRFIVSAIFLLYASVAVIKPDWLAKYHVWSNQKIMGAEFKPSKRTYQFYRGMGLLFAGLAVLLMFGVIE